MASRGSKRKSSALTLRRRCTKNFNTSKKVEDEDDLPTTAHPETQFKLESEEEPVPKKRRIGAMTGIIRKAKRTLRKIKKEKSKKDDTEEQADDRILKAVKIEKREDEDEMPPLIMRVKKEEEPDACNSEFESLADELLLGILAFLEHSTDINAAARVCKKWLRVVKDDYLWKSLSIKRWGPRVIEAEPESWLNYYQRRVGMVAYPIPIESRSPFNLIQEAYCHDPWRLLTAVLLVQRTQGGPKIIDVVSSLFARHPAPQSMFDADSKELREMIKPCGLQDSRLKALIAMSEQFITLDWKQPNEMYGIGALGNDSYNLFCLDKWKTTKTTDRSLNGYIQFRKKVVKKRKHEIDEEESADEVKGVKKEEEDADDAEEEEEEEVKKEEESKQKKRKTKRRRRNW